MPIFLADAQNLPLTGVVGVSSLFAWRCRRSPKGAIMRISSFVSSVALATALAAGSAQATIVTIPDPSPNPYIFFGAGDASVTYSGANFSQSSVLSNGDFFNVGVLFSGDPAVLSSQGQSVGVANILITLPGPETTFALNYGTFNGSAVTFLLSSGPSFTESSTGSDYAVPDFFSVTSTPFTSVLVTSPDDVLNLNNVQFSSATPLPSTWLMLLSGFVGLGFFAYRGTKKNALSLTAA
jgi:hypothetical protein